MPDERPNPDAFLDGAEEIRVMDLTPYQLRQRLHERKVSLEFSCVPPPACGLWFLHSQNEAGGIFSRFMKFHRPDALDQRPAKCEFQNWRALLNSQ